MVTGSTPPPLRTKLVFWLLLGFLSVAIAEVSVASAPLAFVNPFETVFLTLFYGSHLLVVAWLAFRRGWPTFSALWLGGVLFGLYEFYITKVLWAPPWGDTISLAHVDVVALIVLAFFWHPFMAFILPLAIGETVGTKSRWVTGRLPRWLTEAGSRRIAIGIGSAMVLHGMMTGNLALAVVSTASAMAAVLLAVWWWRRGGRSRTWTLRDLLPSDRQGKAIAAVLALQYLVFVPLWNVESIPPLLGHAVVWLLYAGFGLLFHVALRDSSTSAPLASSPAAGWTRRRLIQWAGVLLLLSALGSLGPPEAAAVIIWIGAAIAGIRTLIGTLRRMVRSPAVTTEALPDVRGDDQVHKS